MPLVNQTASDIQSRCVHDFDPGPTIGKGWHWHPRLWRVAAGAIFRLAQELAQVYHPSRRARVLAGLENGERFLGDTRPIRAFHLFHSTGSVRLVLSKRQACDGHGSPDSCITITGIRGDWTSGDNLDTVNRLTAGNKMTLEEASKHTWTYQQAMNKGLPRYHYINEQGSPGQYSSVDVVFLP